MDMNLDYFYIILIFFMIYSIIDKIFYLLK